MLLSYSFKNFHSFDDPVTVSLELSVRDAVQGWTRASPSGQRVTTALAVVGANGAGKTTLVKAVSFLRWFAFDSFDTKPDDPITVVPHLFNGIETPSELTIEFDDQDGTQWKYELQVTTREVLTENLYKKPINQKRYTYLFKRKLIKGKYDIKLQDFGLAMSEAIKVRKNVSLISWAKQYGVKLAEDAASTAFSTNISMYGKSERTSEDLWLAGSFLHENPAHSQTITNLMQKWDFGLQSISVHTTESTDARDPNKNTTHYFPMGEHAFNQKSFSLPFFYESSGTQAALVLLQKIVPILASGGLSVIDEMEDDLHPHMIEAILKLFHDKDTNPFGAQILFTCHSAEILKHLAKEQVVFVEKSNCYSSAYRGDEIDGLKSEHNLYAKYMSGALGAVPEL